MYMKIQREQKNSGKEYNGKNKAFFRSSGEPGHIEHCAYGSENSYDPGRTKEEGFYSEDAISNLMQPAGVSKKTYKAANKKHETGAEDKELIPHTVNQIYNMCKAYSHDDTFNGQMIGQILVDERSIFMYPKGIYGYRLIETKCRAKLYDDSNIYLETPVNNARYQLKLVFKNKYLFREMRSLLYENRNHIIVTAGKWERSEIYNCFMTEFVNKKQIMIRKKEI